jgi:hypothetical protein
VLPGASVGTDIELLARRVLTTGNILAGSANAGESLRKLMELRTGFALKGGCRELAARNRSCVACSRLQINSAFLEFGYQPRRPASDTLMPGSARAWGMGVGRAYSAAFAENVGTMRCQCISVSANTTMTAAPSELMMATGTISLQN